MADDLYAGLYEDVLTDTLARRLDGLDRDLATLHPLRPADVADRIARLVSQQVERALEAVPEDERVARGVDVARRLVAVLSDAVPRVRDALDQPAEPGKVLHGVGQRRPDGTIRQAARPLIPLLDTTLLVNAPGEPRVGNQIGAEIDSADAIDVVMAFIRKSGLRPLMAALREHHARGKPLRVLTTTYTGSTEADALDMLAEVGADIRVSYNTSLTRLHAKAWLFHRRSGFSTAYVGSSNLTHSAQGPGMEWNVRVSAARNLSIIDRIRSVFQAYWESDDFIDYVREDFEARLDRQPKQDTIVLSPVEIRPEPFQERLLEQLALARNLGYHRNLMVAATGTGKTVMAALDYARLKAELPRARLLFVAHREELLDQSLATFRHALRDYSFGEKWVGGARPTAFQHVFASVQSLNARSLDHLEPDHFDVVIVDEFHHAAAPSYQMIMELKPHQMLGLTATPERADGVDILHWFEGRIAAELRLWDAIEQHRLTPFAYYGVHDGTDLTQIPWRRGQGYDVAALAERYTADGGAWVRFVAKQLADHVDSVNDIRCLGFCVSIAHAEYMASQFRELGIKAVAVTGQTRDDVRRAALRDLADGVLQVVFSVDLFNEGVDVPKADTVLMLRPTESATLFLQQLGRGLRLSPGKTVCTVLDFVGLHRQEFRFDRRFRALLGGSRRDVEEAVVGGFPFLPAGCHMELDRKSQEIVLRSIREALPSRWPAKVAELVGLHRSKGQVSLRTYLRETGLDVTDVYGSNHSWSEMCEQAGLQVAPAGPRERDLRRAIGRMLHVDDRQRTTGYQDLLSQEAAPEAENLTPVQRRLARMLAANLGDTVLAKTDSLQDGIDLIWAHPQVRVELRELLDVVGAAPRHLQTPALADIPLQVHSQYTRIEILAALGEGQGAKTPPWREGVYDAKGVGADLLAFTLDKTSGAFSPTTRYRDYAISRTLIHWESQSMTRADSPTGHRYQEHASRDRSILLFARERVTDRAFWFLGKASYVTHEGERPMAVTWELETPLSGDLFATLAAAVA